MKSVGPSALILEEIAVGMRLKRITFIAIIVLVAASSSIASTSAEAPATGAFLTLWQRTDLPVAVGSAHRSWLWGDQVSVNPSFESYKDSPGGVRVVQYFDKGRMEITNPGANPSSPWYVSSGLLTRELITGKLQLGNDTFDDTGQPAKIPVAGDSTNTFPTYADLGSWIDKSAADQTGQPLTAALTPRGETTYNGDASDSETVAAKYFSYAAGGGTSVGYNIPAAFWSFMKQSGPVYEDGKTVMATPLFQWTFLLGYPIGEPFWSRVSLGGRQTWVMIQPFERRILTYTPSNPPNWRVEMGNIGQHYHTWRYSQLSTPVAPATVNVGDFFYRPATLTVPAGTNVVWTVSGSRVNSVIADDGTWESGDLSHDDFYSRVFDEPGTYTYHSRYYAWMKGKIIVTAAPP